LVNAPAEPVLIGPFEENHTVGGFRQFFHKGHVRSTPVNEGVKAMMWVDSSKSWRAMHTENPPQHLEGYPEVVEINIIVSIDNGKSWTAPLIISRLTHREIGNVPAYVWPADKIFILSRNAQGHPDMVRLYFMYTDDLSYGSFNAGTGGPFGEDIGSYIMMAAVDIRLEDVVSENNQTIPRPVSQMTLNQNFPNPFNPSTTINFSIPREGNVNLSVYNVRGQLVKTLVDNEFRQQGENQVVWHGVDNNNRSVSSGVYFYRLEADGRSEVKRMVLMK
jgi:hypothetical protein